MIVRIFRVSVFEDKVSAFRTFFLETALPLMRRTPGCLSVTAGLPRPETPTDFCMVMVWRDLASLEAFVGADWQVPHIHPDEEGIVRERHLHHYTLAEDPATAAEPVQ